MVGSLWKLLQNRLQGCVWDTRQGGSAEHSRDTLRDTIGMDTRQILDGAGVHSRDTCQMLWGRGLSHELLALRVRMFELCAYIFLNNYGLHSCR